MLNMNTALILTILVGVISGFYLPNTKEGPGCKTAAKEEGRCVQVTNCDSLDQLFGQTMSKEKMSFLKNSGCGFDNEIPKICCPVNTDIVINNSSEGFDAVEETTNIPTTNNPSTTINVSGEFDFNSRNGFSSEWPDFNSEDCKGENCMEPNKIASEFL